MIAPSSDDAPAGAPQAEDIHLPIVWQDEYLVIVDKPAGLVVHPAAGHRSGTMVNALLHWAREEDVTLDIDDEERPGIVHRIDKDTSGLLVVALDDRTLRALQARFAAHDIERVYRAVVMGTKMTGTGTRESFIGRSPKDRKRFASLDPARGGRGKRAVTHWRVIARGKALALVEFRARDRPHAPDPRARCRSSATRSSPTRSTATTTSARGATCARPRSRRRRPRLGPCHASRCTPPCWASITRSPASRCASRAPTRPTSRRCSRRCDSGNPSITLTTRTRA